MKGLAYIYVAVAGVLQAFQGGMNTTLKERLGNAWLAGAWIVLLEFLLFGALFLALPGQSPGWEQIKAMPWWAPLGGILGTAVVFGMLAFAGQIGAGPFNGIMITATILTSLALDHYGLVGFKEHAINLWRVVGGVLMIGGVLLIAIF